MQVPLRRLDIYQTDDGRRVEVFTHVKDVDFIKNTAQDEDTNNEEFSKEKQVYVGVVHVGTPVGPKEIKFEIPDVKTVEEALSKYYELAQEAAKTLMKKLENARRQMENAILVPEGSATANGGNKLIVP